MVLILTALFDLVENEIRHVSLTAPGRLFGTCQRRADTHLLQFAYLYFSTQHYLWIMNSIVAAKLWLVGMVAKILH
jgi:hypothetical protein